MGRGIGLLVNLPMPVAFAPYNESYCAQSFTYSAAREASRLALTPSSVRLPLLSISGIRSELRRRRFDGQHFRGRSRKLRNCH